MNILKTLALVVGLTVSVSSFAHGHDGYRGHYRGGYYHHYGWYGPSLVVGGLVGYELAQPRVIYTQPTVVYQDPVIYSQSSTPQVIESGQPSGYHSEVILDGKCNCYRTVLVRN